MTSKNSTVGVLGAGISGLSIGYALQEKGVPFTIYEQNESVGGVIQSTRTEEWLIEKGPNTLMVRSQKVWDLINSLGLDKQLQEANKESKKRFVVRGGKPVSVPLSLLGFLKTDLLSTAAKFRLLKEPFVGPSHKEDESIADFIERRLGREVLDYAVNPIVSGIFAGDPGHLSIKYTFSQLHEMEQESGSIFKGVINRKKKNPSRKALISFAKGLQELPNALHKKMEASVKTKHKISVIDRQNNRWSLHFENGAKKEHEIIISTLPAPILVRCVEDQKAKQLLANLERITYAPMSVIHLGYRREDIRHPLDGFGMLVPESEKLNMLGTLFSSTLFPGRAPEGYELLTTFMGGAAKRELATLPVEDLLARLTPELDHLLGIKEKAAFMNHTYWQRAIPQYEVGYDSFLETMERAENELPNFYLGGNMRDGVSVPDCIENGLNKAEEVANRL